MNSKGDALPAVMLPPTIRFGGTAFNLSPANTGTRNAVVAKGQTIDLPPGTFNRVYILAASTNGDQSADFLLGNQTTSLKIQDGGASLGNGIRGFGRTSHATGRLQRTTQHGRHLT